jgi:hypothetical protein
MKKFFTKPFIYGLIVAAAAFLLAACADPVTPHPGTATAPGTGQVRVHFTDDPARTIYPAKVFDHYVYTFYHGDETTGEVKTPTGDIFTLEAGSWTLAVEAYAGEADETLAATGSTAAFTVNDGQLTDNITVTLTPVGSEGTGTVSYTITYPAGATLETLSWQQLGGTGTTDLKTGVTPSTADSVTTFAGTKPTIDAGYYLISATLTDGAGKTAGKSEVVHIYKNACFVMTAILQ